MAALRTGCARLPALLLLAAGCCRLEAVVLPGALSLLYHGATSRVTSCPGDGDFLCGDWKACVAGDLRCDGVADCSDGSDERDCLDGGTTPEELKAQCLPPRLWCGVCVDDSHRCDGERDCADGADEAGCDTPCPGGFRCDDGSCLHASWQCDGERDCTGGEDERNCSRPAATCQPGEFRCADGQRCLDAARACDSRVDCADGSDEGGGCARRDTCPAGACPAGQLCRPSPAGGHLCHCPAGSRADAAGACRDAAPCAAAGGCEHRCLETAGRCGCPADLTLAADNRTCELDPAAAEPTLLMADGRAVRQLRLRSRQLRTLAPAGDARLLAVAGDLATRTVYWSFRGEDGTSGVLRRTDFEDAAAEPFLLSGLQTVDALAWEWVARALYLADAGRRHLAACDWLGHCAVLVPALAERPLALAVFPQERALFWSAVGAGGGRIVRSGLDGRGADALPLPGLEAPGALAVDPAGGRLYWSDAGRRMIESCRPDGADRRPVPELMVRSPFALAVLGRALLWSDLDSEEVHACDKLTGKNRTVVFKRDGRWSFALAALHGSLQPPLANPCLGARCSHLCVLSPTADAGFRCLCAERATLGVDGFTCHRDNASRVVVAGSDRLLDVSVNVLGGPGFSQMALPARMVTALALDYLPAGGGALNLTLLYADSAAGRVYGYDVERRQRRELARDHVTTVVALAADPVRGNVYWGDSARGTVELARADGRHRRLVAAGLRHLTGLAVSAARRLLFVALGGPAGAIQQLELDGARRRPFVSDGLLTPCSLSADDAGSRLFWADAHQAAIESVRYDGSERRVLKRHLAGPLSVAVSGGLIYWTNLYSEQLHWIDSREPGVRFSQPLGRPGADGGGRALLQVAAAGPDRRVRLRQLIAASACPGRGCAELCLAGAGGEACACGTGRRTAADGRACRPAACGAHEFACRSGACLQAAWRCDGSPDCPGGEDEAGCAQQRAAACGPGHFNCSSGECLSPVLRCDGAPHCADGGDERGCAEHACASGELRCGTGFCVPAHYRCDNQNDCTDGSDERDCGRAACPAGTFTCAGNGRCIADDWVCDGQPDCADLSDEPADCRSRRNCAPPERRCRDGRCLDARLWCDGVPDCVDGGDEGAHCGAALPPLAPRANASCAADERACDDGRCLVGRLWCDGAVDCDGGEDEEGCGEPTCPGTGRRIAAQWLCDGEADCEDGWDEASGQCDGRPPVTAAPPPAAACRPDQFACADGLDCLDVGEVCDGLAHCDDRSDEGGLCETACSTNICADRCRPTPTAPVCGCADGFELRPDGKTCRDVDECTRDAPCWQLCNNTEGGFKCGCLPGYWLEPDGVTCRATTSPWLLVTHAGRVIADQIRRQRDELVFRNRNATLAFSDYDSWTDTLYFYDSYQGGVFATPRGTVYAAGSPPPRRMVANVTDLTAMAFEWTTKSVYLASREADTGVLRACAADGACRTLARTPGETLLALRPVPERGLLLACAEVLASAAGRRRGRVLQLSADGAERRVLAERKVLRCGGIDLDRTTGRVWWSDTHLHRLGSARLDGGERVQVDVPGLHLPRGLAVFEDWAYMISHRSRVRRCHTRLRKDETGRFVPLRNNSAAHCEHVYDEGMELKAVDVVHRLRQPLLLGLEDGSRSVCVTHGRCRSMCLPRGGQVACFCPDQLPDCESERSGGQAAPAAGSSAGAAARGATIATVLCVAALVLAAAAVWLRRRQRGDAAGPVTHNQFHNLTFGLTPPQEAPDLGAPAAWALDGGDANNNAGGDGKWPPGAGRPAASGPQHDGSPQMKESHVQLGLGARSQDSGFLELGSVGFSSMERLVQ